MVQERLIEWGSEYRRSGLDSASGAMAPNRIARLVLQRNTLWCRCGKQYRCRKAFRWNRVPVLVFPALPRIALFMSAARWMDALYWFREARAQLGLVLSNWRTEPERELLPPAGLKATWKSRHRQVPIKSC